MQLYLQPQSSLHYLCIKIEVGIISSIFSFCANSAAKRARSPLLAATPPARSNKTKTEPSTKKPSRRSPSIRPGSAVDDMFGLSDRAADYSVLPTSIFTEPEGAGAGSRSARRATRASTTNGSRTTSGHVQRSSYKEQKRGLYKIVYETGTRRVLGLHVVAPNAGEIVQGF